MSEWCLVKIKLSYSNLYYEFLKNLSILDEYSNAFQRQFIFMYLQINAIENGERCI